MKESMEGEEGSQAFIAHVPVPSQKEVKTKQAASYTASKLHL